MTRPKLGSAIAILAALAAFTSQAEARRYHHGYAYGLPYPISYLHNYGPGLLPGTFAFYDGPSTNSCVQGSANYRAQGGLYPCF